jgi:hypothetical protein
LKIYENKNVYDRGDFNKKCQKFSSTNFHIELRSALSEN